MTQTDSSSIADPLAVGDKVLDRYRVVERLETGGTSVVYRGEDERLSRPVCIKVFHTLRDKELTALVPTGVAMTSQLLRLSVEGCGHQLTGELGRVFTRIG